MRRNGYGGYRGRRTGREALKYVIIGLIVLIGVLAAAFVLSAVLHINVMYIILGTALLGVLRAIVGARKNRGGAEK